MKITIKELLDRGLWKKYCEDNGINEWAVNEGLIDKNKEVEWVHKKEETMKTHTPTPWILVNNQIRTLNEENYFSIADVLSPVESCPQKENAEFIVRACNNHDRLVELLKWSTEIIRNYRKELDQFEDDEDYFKQVEGVLKQAEEPCIK